MLCEVTLVAVAVQPGEKLRLSRGLAQGSSVVARRVDGALAVATSTVKSPAGSGIQTNFLAINFARSIFSVRWEEM